MDRTTLTLADIVRAAAWQRRSMMPVINDKTFVRNGGTIFYAVDTDIIRLYASPYIDELAPRQSTYEPGSTYTQVFPQDNPVLSEAVGRTLVDYIFFRLSPKCAGRDFPPGSSPGFQRNDD